MIAHDLIQNHERANIQMDSKAKWIWHPDLDGVSYNETIFLEKEFDIALFDSAMMAITADSWYRVYINGVWINDGPCRSWPEHYQYDLIDIKNWLKKGKNKISVIARYFGAGTFHKIPLRGGFLCQLTISSSSTETIKILSDDSWRTSVASQWVQHVPKVGLGMEPGEHYDARLQPTDFVPAKILCDAHDGPWKDLNERDVAFLTKKPFYPSCIKEARIVSPLWQGYTFSPIKLIYPGLIEGEGGTCMASMAATVIESDKDVELSILPYPPAEGPTITVNGGVGEDGKFQIKKGRNFLCAFLEPWGHHNKEQGVQFDSEEMIKIVHPVNAESENPWAFVPLKGLAYHEHDGKPPEWDPPARKEIQKKVQDQYKDLGKRITNVEAFKSEFQSDILDPVNKSYPVENPHWQFECRKDLGDAIDLLEKPENSITENPSNTIVKPSTQGDIEICYDLGEQNCGYIEFDLEASEGTVIDVFAIEYITPDGDIQHTWGNRNGFRYYCKEGHNRFLSLKRRAGRYLYMTIRNMSEPVSIRLVRLIESTYPVNRLGSFSCSDSTLTEIWRICERTLKLCMEDVFTDCPLYEQTLWVGDARNEAIFAMTAYGQLDIVRRCIVLAGQGLERLPIVPSHCPTSCGECLLPAWAFLWGISVWDYYLYSEDIDFVREVWPMVKQNLDGARSLSDDRGLFSAPFWNMFDWTRIDDGHQTVTHNSMLLIGCIDAGIKCARLLEDKEAEAEYTDWKEKLKKAVNKLWDKDKASYIDSVHEDGKLSEEISIHTSFLSLLFDIVEESNEDKALQNVLNPPEEMTLPGSPFVMLYLYNTLEKYGQIDRLIDHIFESYIPMLRVGATTVWEQFDNGLAYNPDGYPTRSHSHAWSSSPVYFLNRLILGIRQTEIGCRKYIISPWVQRTDWAKGSTATNFGPVSVSWELKNGKLRIDAKAPKEIELEYQFNETHSDLEVVYNGKPISDEERVSGDDVWKSLS